MEGRWVIRTDHDRDGRIAHFLPARFELVTLCGQKFDWACDPPLRARHCKKCQQIRRRRS